MSTRKRTLTIGELASRTGRSAHTLRYYESAGLIPGVVRDEEGRRVYSHRHVGWLELLQRLRQSGMSIQEMKQYAELVERGESTVGNRKDFLLEHGRNIQQKIDELQQCLALVKDKVKFYDRWLSLGHRPRRPPRLSGSEQPGTHEKIC